METAVLIVAGVGGIAALGAMVYAGWGSWCNDRTYSQRSLYLKRAYALAQAGDREGFMRAHADFERVSYDKHMYSLMKLRDPTPLYGNHSWLFEKTI